MIMYQKIFKYWYFCISTDSHIQWRLESNGSVLLLPSVSVNDRFTVHCNASNVHGYVLSGAYLIVSRKYHSICLPNGMHINPFKWHIDITDINYYKSVRFNSVLTSRTNCLWYKWLAKMTFNTKHYTNKKCMPDKYTVYI